MLKEITMFVDKFNSQKQSGSKGRYGNGKLVDKLIIINTKKKNDLLVYDRIQVLDDEDRVKDWKKSNIHYGKIIQNVMYYVLPSAINKALGSTGGLLTYTFFLFKLSDKNLAKLSSKIDKTKFRDSHDELIKTIHAILHAAESALVKKIDNKYQYLDFYVLIRVDKDTFEDWHKIACDYIEKKRSIGNTSSTVKGICFVCNKEEVDVSASPFLTNYDEKKIFLKHKTLHEKNGIPAYICPDCGKKSSEFEKILKDYDLKIFPLFVDPEDQYDEIEFLSDGLEGKNKFSPILGKLVKRREKNLFDFYLVVKSKDYFFFDYITGYEWNVGIFTDYFNQDGNLSPASRSKLESLMASVLTGKEQIPYFDKLQNMDNQEATLVYSLRQKIFDFVYRNKNTLTYKDLQTLVLFRIEKSIKNGTKPKLETFNLFFNRSLLLKDDDPDDFLEKMRKIKDEFISEKEQPFDIRSDEEWAYFAGQVAFYLVSLSKTKDKTFGLLEPFTNKSTTDLVKKTIEQLFEQYRYDISLGNRRFKKIVTSVFSYSPCLSFVDLKIPFYTGACDDDNVIYRKEKGSV